MESKYNIKCCPFCGGKADLEIVDVYREYFIQCRKCGVEQGHLYKSKKSAITAWNRRRTESN